MSRVVKLPPDTLSELVVIWSCPLLAMTTLPPLTVPVDELDNDKRLAPEYCTLPPDTENDDELNDVLTLDEALNEPLETDNELPLWSVTARESWNTTLPPDTENDDDDTALTLPVPENVIEPSETVSDDAVLENVAAPDTTTLPPDTVAVACCKLRALDCWMARLPPDTERLVVSNALNTDEPENKKLPDCTAIDDPVVMVTVADPPTATLPPEIVAAVLPERPTLAASVATKLPPLMLTPLLDENDSWLLAWNCTLPPVTLSVEPEYEVMVVPWKIALPLLTVTLDDVTGMLDASDTTKLPPDTCTVDDDVTWNCELFDRVKLPDATDTVECDATICAVDVNPSEPPLTDTTELADSDMLPADNEMLPVLTCIVDDTKVTLLVEVYTKLPPVMLHCELTIESEA